MSVKFRDIWTGAAFRADLSVNGPGPHLTERVNDNEWRTLTNKAITSAWRLASAARPDFQMTSFDFTLANGGSASVALPSNFFAEIDVCFGPDTPQEYSLGSFAFANRRSPGGWFPANFGGTTNYGGNAIRIMGNTLFVEPSLRAAGNYRLWFCPQPKLIRADGTVVAATTVPLPTCTTAGTGPTKTLTAIINGALVIDGVSPSAGQSVLIQSQGIPNPLGAIDNGVYDVVNAGSVSTQWQLRRNATIGQQVTQGNLGTMIYVTSGTANTDLFFETTSLATVIDSTAWTWSEAFIEPILEQFSELLEITTAIPAMLRDDDLDPSKLILRAYGPDGTSGLTGEMKSYFRQVRMGGTVQKMTDTDMRGPRSPWSI